MRTTGGRRRTWLAAALVVLAAGCSGGSDHPGSRSAAPDVHTLPTAATSTTRPPGVGLPTVPLRRGWPAARPVAVEVGEHPGQRFVAEAPMGDRPVLLGWAMQDPRPEPSAEHTSVGGIGVAALDARTGALTILRRFDTSEFQSTVPDAEGDWVVWAEDDSASMNMPDWTIWAHDLRTHQSHRVATHPVDAQGRAPSTPLFNATISHGIVAWSTLALDGHLHVYTAPVEGGPVADVLTDAADAHIAWPYLAAVHVTGAGSDLSSSITLDDLRTGQQVTIPGTAGARSIAISPETVVWLEGTGNPSVYEADLDGSHRRLLDAGRTPQFPSVGDGVVAWDGYADGPMLVRDRAKEILSLGTGQAAVIAKGRYVLWSVRGGDGYRLLDVG